MSALLKFIPSTRIIALSCLKSQQNTKYSSNLVSSAVASRNFTSTPTRCDLMEFFDDKKNWGENEVKVGRNWNLDELRIKSNTDLHKLWFVLLKERNMLLTMEHECNDKMELFPSPERRDKIELSMKNLETVVRERNRAYHELETGETGEVNGNVKPNEFGLNKWTWEREHLIPKEENRGWQIRSMARPRGSAVHKFLSLYREKLWNEKRKSRNRNRNEVMHLLRRFPNIDRNVLAGRYPDVDINKVEKSGKARGHFVPEV